MVSLLDRLPLSPESRPADPDGFWARIDRHGPPAHHRPDLGVCWPWTGTVTVYGYGQVRWQGRCVHAHRVAWALAGAVDLPPGLKIGHFACDLRSCCNPAHVRPRVAQDTPEGARFLAAWNQSHDTCLDGHPFTPANTITVPGGRACRACRRRIEQGRRRRVTTP